MDLDINQQFDIQARSKVGYGSKIFFWVSVHYLQSIELVVVRP